jgi:hypothetical protein
LRDQRERLYFNTEIAARPLSERETARYNWFAARNLKDVLTGKLSNTLSKK